MSATSFIEWLCLQELAQFARRHQRYLVLGLGVYLYSLGGWRRLQPLRAGFCVAQHVDDVLDGQRVVPEPEAYVAHVVRQLETNTYDHQTPLSFLAETVGTASELARQELVALMRTLQFDGQRRAARATYPAATLTAHHQRTFAHSINFILVLLGSPLRATDVPELVGAFAWVSPMRDLREDLALGLINVPAEVLAQARSEGAATLNYDHLLATPAVRAWVRAEFQRGQAHLQAFAQRWPTLRGQPGAREIGVFFRAIQQFARGYARAQRAILQSG